MYMVGFFNFSIYNTYNFIMVLFKTYKLNVEWIMLTLQYPAYFQLFMELYFLYWKNNTIKTNRETFKQTKRKIHLSILVAGKV